MVNWWCDQGVIRNRGTNGMSLIEVAAIVQRYSEFPKRNSLVRDVVEIKLHNFRQGAFCARRRRVSRRRPTDRSAIQRRLAETNERIARGELQICSVPRAVAGLEANGRLAADAKRLLAGFEQLQVARKDSRDWLLKQLGVKPRNDNPTDERRKPHHLTSPGTRYGWPTGPLEEERLSKLDNAIRQSKKIGRKPKFDWDDAKAFAQQEWNKRGPLNNVDTGRKSTADLERLVADYMSRHDDKGEPSTSVLKEHVSAWVLEFQADN